MVDIRGHEIEVNGYYFETKWGVMSESTLETLQTCEDLATILMMMGRAKDAAICQNSDDARQALDEEIMAMDCDEFADAIGATKLFHYDEEPYDSRAEDKAVERHYLGAYA